MTTSVEARRHAARAFVSTTALAKAVEFTPEMMEVYLTDGRVLSVRLIWFPTLRAATAEQRRNVRIGAGGRGLHWPDLDEDSFRCRLDGRSRPAGGLISSGLRLLESYAISPHRLASEHRQAVGYARWHLELLP